MLNFRYLPSGEVATALVSFSSFSSCSLLFSDTVGLGAGVEGPLGLLASSSDSELTSTMLANGTMDGRRSICAASTGEIGDIAGIGSTFSSKVAGSSGDQAEREVPGGS
ncbi:hypothetical protein FKM82_018062 [Ascaphus truei]